MPLGVLSLLCDALARCGALSVTWPPRAARIRAAMQHGATCEQCSEAARVVFATPCGHLLCVDCTSRSEQCCPVCAEPYLMQVSHQGMATLGAELSFRTAASRASMKTAGGLSVQPLKGALALNRTGWSELSLLHPGRHVGLLCLHEGSPQEIPRA